MAELQKFMGMTLGGDGQKDAYITFVYETDEGKKMARFSTEVDMDKDTENKLRLAIQSMGMANFDVVQAINSGFLELEDWDHE